MAAPTMDAVLSGQASFAEYFKLSPDVDHDPGLTRQEIKAAFLAHLRRNPLITDACIAVGMSRQTINVWRQSDPDFNAAVLNTLDAATADYTEQLRHGLYRRAMLELQPERTGVPVTSIFVFKGLDNRFRDNYTAPAETTARQSLRFMVDSERDQAIQGEYSTVPALPSPDASTEPVE